MTVIKHTIRALAPISHNEIGKDAGNITQFRRIHRVVGSQVQRVPAISAGALRGVVRRHLWREAFEAVGLSRETLGSPAWDRLYAALANGGTIEAAETRVVPELIRARRAAMPVLSLLGSALYSGFVAGRLQCSHAWLACAETGTGPLSMHDLMQEVSTVRHVSREEQDPDLSGVGPMPTTTELVMAGADFVGRSSISGALEASAWAHGLDLVTHLGGKSGQGCGEVVIEHTGDGSAYVEWLAANAEPLRTALLTLSSELTKSKKAPKADKRPAKGARVEAEPAEPDDLEGL